MTPRPDTTRRLTQRIAAGDHDAFTSLYQSRFAGLVRYVRSATRRDEAFCLDVVQEVMLKVIRKLPTLDDERALDAWLRRTALRCAHDQLRAERRRRAREIAAPPAEHTADADPEADAALRRAAEREVAELSQRDPVVGWLFAARFRFGWTLARAGEPVGLSPSAADGKLRRSLASLRAALDTPPPTTSAPAQPKPDAETADAPPRPKGPTP